MRTPTILLAAALATACVPRSQYAALEASYDDLAEAYAAQDAWADAQAVRIDRLQLALEAEEADDARLMAWHRDLLEAFHDELESGEVMVLLHPDRTSLVLTENVTFPTGEATVSDRGRDLLATAAAVLREHPGRAFEIEGHTDARPIDNRAYDDNWALGAARSLNVLRVLVDQGVAPDQLSAASYAATDPLLDDESDAAMAQNRRIEISLQPSIDELPGHLWLLREAHRHDGLNVAPTTENLSVAH